MDNFRKAAGLILILIMAVMAAVERPGEGAEKKAEAVAALNQIDDVKTENPPVFSAPPPANQRGGGKNHTRSDWAPVAQATTGPLSLPRFTATEPGALATDQAKRRTSIPAAVGDTPRRTGSQAR